MGYVICAGERVQVACPGPPPHTGGSGRGEVYGPNGGPSPTGKRTEVAFEKEIEFERGFGLFSNWKREKTIGDKVARFRGSERGQAERASRCTRIPNGTRLGLAIAREIARAGESRLVSNTSSGAVFEIELPWRPS